MLKFICADFSISFFFCHSNVIHRKICVKDFSGTTPSRILKCGTNVGYDLSHCVKENMPFPAFFPPFSSYAPLGS